MRRSLLALGLLGAVGCAAPGAMQPPPVAPGAPVVPPPLVPAPAESVDGSAPPPGVIPAVAAENPDANGSDDDVDDGDEPTSSASAPKHAPELKLTAEEIQEKLRNDPASLGPVSIGSPNAGALLNGVQLPDGEEWVRVDPANEWGTQETIDQLTHCIHRVNEELPGSPKMYVGHISGRRGGHLSPHKSHQSGRDVDLGYYNDKPGQWFARATAQNLDKPRTWAFLKCVLKESDTQYVFIDTSIQTLLKDYAKKAGEDEAWLDEVFQVGGKGQRAIVRHVKGHATHMHVRFFSPVAQALGEHAHFLLGKTAQASSSGRESAPSAPQPVFVSHKAKNGDTLVVLAKHYGTTVEAIQQANNLKSTHLKIGETYKIPVTGKQAAVAQTGKGKPQPEPQKKGGGAPKATAQKPQPAPPAGRPRPTTSK